MSDERRVETKSPLFAAASERVKPELAKDSGDRFLSFLRGIALQDVDGLVRAQKSYGNSWKQRGGIGAFMMQARKWDRMENRVKRDLPGAPAYDIFAHVAIDPRAEGVIDDIRDLRRYLLLVEAELLARGYSSTHRDNVAGSDGLPIVPKPEPLRTIHDAEAER